jgi:hypothetical protein
MRAAQKLTRYRTRIGTISTEVFPHSVRRSTRTTGLLAERISVCSRRSSFIPIVRATTRRACCDHLITLSHLTVICLSKLNVSGHLYSTVCHTAGSLCASFFSSCLVPGYVERTVEVVCMYVCMYVCVACDNTNTVMRICVSYSRTYVAGASKSSPTRLWDPSSLFSGYPELFSHGYSGESVKLTTRFHLVLRFRMSWDIHPFLHVPSWLAQRYLYLVSKIVMWMLNIRLQRDTFVWASESPELTWPRFRGSDWS